MILIVVNLGSLRFLLNYFNNQIDYYKQQNIDLINRLQAKDLATYAQLSDIVSHNAGSSDSSENNYLQGLTDDEEIRRISQAFGGDIGYGEVLVEQAIDPDQEQEELTQDYRDLGLV